MGLFKTSTVLQVPKRCYKLYNTIDYELFIYVHYNYTC